MGTEPGCDEVIPGSGVQEFCTCSTLEVPDYAPAGTIVEVTWKLLQTPSGTNVDVCEQKFDIENLWKEERKETLACLKIQLQSRIAKTSATRMMRKLKGEPMDHVQ